MKDNELIEKLKEFDERRVEQLNDNARNLFNAIMDIADSRDKYKSLYENEKEHTDTLKRIIKKIEEYCNSIIKGCDVKDDDGNYLYFYPPYMDDILDLLKEIK